MQNQTPFPHQQYGRARAGCIPFHHQQYVPVFQIRSHLIRFGIQHFRLNTDPYPIWIQGFDAGCIPFRNQQCEHAGCTFV